MGGPLAKCTKCKKLLDITCEVHFFHGYCKDLRCADCAEFQCWTYSVRDLSASYANTWRGGFTKAKSELEAIEKLCSEFQVSSEHVRVDYAGTYSDFKKEMSKKWD